MSRGGKWGDGVREKRAKGHRYWYWTRSDPWTALPSPLADPDGFMRKLAHLRRVSIRIEERRREGTFGALAKLYFASPQFAKMRPNSQAGYTRYLMRLLAAYADAPLAELTPEDIQVRVMDANADTPAAADQMLTILRTLYKFGAKRQRGLEDWTRGLEPYQGHQDIPPWPERALRAALEGADRLFALAVAVHLYTGQRTGDACAMTRHAIRGSAIAVKQQKTGAELEIEMHPDLAAMLVAAPAHVMILTNTKGGPLTKAAFSKWCERFSAKMGLRLAPHGLRKNATNALFEAGCTAAEVASITGHKSLRMLEHYGKARNQPKLARVAAAKWGAETERERENLRGEGKPGAENG